MNHRERFIATMHYQPRDRVPLYDFNYWDETIPEWRKQGLPTTVTQRNAREYFGLDCSLAGGQPPYWGAGWNGDLCPAFEGKILTDNGDEYTQLDGDGVIVRLFSPGVPYATRVGYAGHDVLAAWRCDALERTVHPLAVDGAGADLAATAGTSTVRLRLRARPA